MFRHRAGSAVLSSKQPHFISPLSQTGSIDSVTSRQLHRTLEEAEEKYWDGSIVELGYNQIKIVFLCLWNLHTQS